MTPDARSVAARAYDTLAPAYDALTAGYPYERWIDELERIAVHHGLQGRRVLDVACGTGHSLVPWVDRGYVVTGVDVSPGMVAVARAKVGKRAPVLVSDMRALPELGPFDLVTCLGDAMNHLLSLREVEVALGEMRRVLAPRGLAIFDLNLLRAYRETPDTIVEEDDRVVLWPGARARIEVPGGLAHVVVDVFEREGALWRRLRSCQPHRHHPPGEVLQRAHAAGLEVAGVYGQRPGVRVERRVDENLHTKAIVVARAG